LKLVLLEHFDLRQTVSETDTSTRRSLLHCSGAAARLKATLRRMRGLDPRRALPRIGIYGSDGGLRIVPAGTRFWAGEALPGTQPLLRNCRLGDLARRQRQRRRRGRDSELCKVRLDGGIVGGELRPIDVEDFEVLLERRLSVLRVRS
jgi:hypothetical protein